ncbi:hypothetical protein ACFW2I_09175 [Streptomyces nigra]|uniref:hypothetical protein n=1 Tax=Streptomyces nigra TaxID=1827580 RepID=UPI0036B03196
MSAELKNVTLAANEMAREIERLKIERDELAVAAKRASVCLQQFIDDNVDPGTEALAAQYEVNRLLAKLEVNGAVVEESEYLSRFSVTPAEVHRFLAASLAEDVHLRYQQAVGNRAVEEAAKDIRMESHSPLAGEKFTNGMVFAADHIDPLKGGGHYPSELIRFGEAGGAR